MPLGPGEFQERLTLSQLEANHSLIFLVCLVIIRCIWVNIVMIYINSWGVKYERSTTSRWVSKKDNNSITSARGLVLYITFRLRKFFLNLAKRIIRLWIMAWLCFYFIRISCNILRLYVFIYSCYCFPLFHKLSYIYNIRKESNRKNSCIFDHKKKKYSIQTKLYFHRHLFVVVNVSKCFSWNVRTYKTIIFYYYFGLQI